MDLGQYRRGKKEYFVHVIPITEQTRKWYPPRRQKYNYMIEEHLPRTSTRTPKKWYTMKPPQLDRGIGGFGIMFQRSALQIKKRRKR